MGVAASTSAGWTCTALAQGGKREPGDEIKFSDLFADEMLQEAQPKRSRAGLIALGGIGTVVTGVIVGVLPFITVAFRRHPLPYVPATSKQIRMVLKHCKACPNDALAATAPRLVDLGSGDGRVVIQAAKKGIRSKGYEINSWLVVYSMYSAWRQGLSRLASFHRKNLWKASLSEFDYIVLFGAKDATSFMEDLEDKLIEEETKEGAKVIACRFPMSTFTPIYEEVDPAGEKGLESVWVYDLDAEKAKFRELEEDDYTASS
mmetsp:Transcript_8743/g.13818  ORF Transcript_8743/g.13818 Transcript_8743/m.13818 type:complete len:261 (-) Transcript_8743:191-973(-)